MCSKQYKCIILFNYHGEMCNVYVYVWFLINTLYRIYIQSNIALKDILLRFTDDLIGILELFYILNHCL
jgi:hypothetical protein